jgi:hypothetical protein
MTAGDFHFAGISLDKRMIPEHRCQPPIMKRRARIRDVRFNRENLTSKGNGE